MWWAIFIFMYLMGAWDMWEEVRDQECSPSPEGAFYDLRLEAVYASHPEMHRTLTIFFQAASVMLWPLVIGGGIIGLALRGKLRVL